MTYGTEWVDWDQETVERWQDTKDRQRKLDFIKKEWKDLKNDGVKKQYCNRLEELIQNLEQEIYCQKIEIRKRIKIGYTFGTLFFLSLMIHFTILIGVIFGN